MTQNSKMNPKTGKTEYAIDYGVIRYQDRDGRSSWYVSVRRHGIQIRRSFHDDIWGGEKEALAMASAYRTDIIKALPPMTNHAIRTKVKKNNTSGISGVSRQLNSQKKAYWIGELSTPPKKRKSFPVALHGEEGAKALAIAFREKALAESTLAFVTSNPQATEATDTQFAELLKTSDISVLHKPLMDKAQIKETVSVLNARYDALIPERLHVYLVTLPSRQDALSVIVTGGRQGSRNKNRKATSYSFKQNTFVSALAHARTFIENAITQLYNRDVAQTFMSDYENTLSDKGFDPSKGFVVEVIIPASK